LKRKVIVSICVLLGVVFSFGAGWGIRNQEVVKQTIIAGEAQARAEDEEALKGKALEQIKALEKIKENLMTKVETTESAKEAALKQVEALKIANEEAIRAGELAKQEAVAQAKKEGLVEGEEIGYKKGYDEGYQKDRPRDPVYSEVEKIIRNSTFSLFPWASCASLTADFVNEMREKGIRTGTVFIDFYGAGHAIVAFDTPDKGLIYFDWVSVTKGENVFIMREVKVDLEKRDFRYFKENNLSLPYPGFNDIVYGVSIIW